MMKQAYKSYRIIENVKMQKVCVMRRFMGRVIEYTGMHVVMLFLLLCLHLNCLPYILVLHTCSYFAESELNKANKYIYF